jgi:hypothetical protein
MARIAHISGTWSRTNTSRSDAYWWRARIRAAARRFGGELEYVLPQGQKDENNGYGKGTKSGTFKATVPLPHNYHATKQNEDAALHVIEAALALNMCRPPKLKLNRKATYLERADYVPSVL